MPSNVIVLEPRTPIHERQQHDPIAMACRDVELATADFMHAILATTDVNTLVRLRRQLHALIAILDAVESSASEKEDRILRERD